MSFPSPLAPVLTQLDAQTKQLQHLKQRSRSRGRAVAGVINWVHWGLEKSCCKQNGGLFLTVSPSVVKMSLKMSALHLPLPGMSLLALSGSSGRLWRQLPKRILLLDPFLCSLRKELGTE